MTKRDREIVNTMGYSNRGMQGYKHIAGYCNLLRGNFEDLVVRSGKTSTIKPLRGKSKHHGKGKPTDWSGLFAKI